MPFRIRTGLKHWPLDFCTVYQWYRRRSWKFRITALCRRLENFPWDKMHGGLRPTSNWSEFTSEWSSKNALPFNIEKCEKITYTRNTKRIIVQDYSLKGHILRKVEEVKDLEVIMDRGVTWRTHTRQMINKAKRSLGFLIRRSCNFKNIKKIPTLYYALVRSHLKFATIIWNPLLKSSRLRQ